MAPPNRKVNKNNQSTGNKRIAEADSAGPSTKQRVVEPTGNEAKAAPPKQLSTNILQDSMGLTGTGKEIASGGGSSDGQEEYHIEKPLSVFGDKVSVYRKSHKFMTFGLAPAIIDGVSPGSTNDRWLTTYLAEVPWHLPAFYLNQSEYDLLPNGSHCIEVSIQCIYRGATIQFETAASTSGLATLNQINDIAYGHALNKTQWGSNVSYTNFQTAPNNMIPSSIAKPKYAPVAGTYRGMIQDYYGTGNGNANFSSYIPHHQIGRQTFLYNYWAMSTRISAGTAPPPAYNLYGGWPALSEKIQQLDGKTVVNQVVTTSTYVPKMGQLKSPLKHIGLGLPYPNMGDPVNVLVQGNLVAPRVLVATRDPAGTAASQQSDGDRWIVGEDQSNFSNDNSGTTPTVLTWNIYSPIEKSQVSRSGFWGSQDPHIQPSCHIGVQPVPSLSTAALLLEDGVHNSWTDTRAYWEIIATMKIKEYEPTHLPYATAPNVPQGDVIMEMPNSAMPDYYKDVTQDHATFAGLYKYTTPFLP